MSEEDIKESIKDLKKSIVNIETYVIDGIKVRADMAAKLIHLEGKLNDHMVHEEKLLGSLETRITLLERYKIKWDGFKWAWAILFISLGTAAQSFFKWIGGLIPHG